MADQVTPPVGLQKMESAPTWDFLEEPVFEGWFLRSEGNVGPNHSNIYEFKKKDGSVMAVWGNTILDGRFKNIEAGEFVWIHFLGKVESEKRKGSFYNNFEVYHGQVPMTDERLEVLDK